MCYVFLNVYFLYFIQQYMYREFCVVRWIHTTDVWAMLDYMRSI